MAWMKSGAAKTMGEAAEEWLRRNAVVRRGSNATAPAAGKTKPKRLAAE
jgi:hypothetical protein